MSVVRALAIGSGAIFLIYGVLCFTSPSMASDFHRFGVDSLKPVTGVLELLGGAGLLIGLRWLPLLRLSAAGLALLMLIAFGFRMHMRDGIGVSLPSFLLMLLNVYILFRARDVRASEAVQA